MKLASLLGVVCLSTVAMAQDVTFNYDRSANFGSYRTYQWVESQNGNQLMDQNIKQSIDAQLALKGLRRVESGASRLAIKWLRKRKSSSTAGVAARVSTATPA